MLRLLRSLKLQASPLRTATLLAFGLLLSGCGKQSTRPTVYVDAGAPNPTTTKGPAPSDSEVLDDEALAKEEKAIDDALKGEVPDKEMSRDTFLKLIEKAKKSIQPEPTPSTEPTSAPEEKSTKEPEVSPPVPSPTPSPIPSVKPPLKPSPTPAPSPVIEKKVEEKPTTIWPARTPRPKPSPVPSPKPKKEIEPAPPSADTSDDVGIDEEDEIASTQYSGPKTVVDRPKSTPTFQLSEIAANLGSMKTAEYRRIQIDTMDTAYRACNFFLITALVEARVADKNDLPLLKAAQFDDKYLIPQGWKKIPVETMKKWFRDGKSFDVVLQREAPKGKNYGHVAIPVGLNAEGQVMVAEGVLQKVSNRIRVYTDKEIATKFRIFARYE